MANSPYINKIIEHNVHGYFSAEEADGTLREAPHNTSFWPYGNITYRQKSPNGLGYGVKFNDGVFFSTTDYFSQSSNQFGIEFWAKITTLESGVHSVMGKTYCYLINMNVDSLDFILVDSLGGSHTLTYTGIATQDDGEWHHYFYNYNGNNNAFKLFIDGVEKVSIPFSGLVKFASGLRTVFGSGVQLDNGFSTNYWHGSLDAIAFYSYSLNSTQIAEHYTLGVAPTAECEPVTVDFGFSAKLDNAHLAMDATTINFGANCDIDADGIIIDRGQPWWDYKYPYRRLLAFQASPTGMPKDHLMSVRISSQILTQGKVLQDLSDLKIAYLSSLYPQSWTVLPKSITKTASEYKVYFPLAESLEPDEVINGRYYLYYGSKISDTQLPYDGDAWPITLYPDSPDLDYTNPEKDWDFGKAVNDQAKMTLMFYGSSIRVHAMVGPDQGIAEVQINDSDWFNVDLFAFTKEEVEVLSIPGLPNIRSNYLRYRVSGQSNSSSRGIGINFTNIQYAHHSEFTDIQEEVDNNKIWNSSIGGVLSVV